MTTTPAGSAPAPIRAALMVTCLGDMFFPEVGVRIVRLLRRLGVQVEFPPAQTCCGMPLFNSGYHDDAARIARLPDGAVVVNTARGSLVEDAALIAALRSGKLFAAGLDVFENEPSLHPAYRELANVFLLPHLGSATVETRDAMGFRALDNLEAFFAGRQPPDRLA